MIEEEPEKRAFLWRWQHVIAIVAMMGSLAGAVFVGVRLYKEVLSPGSPDEGSATSSPSTSPFEPTSTASSTFAAAATTTAQAAENNLGVHLGSALSPSSTADCRSEELGAGRHGN